MVKILQVKDILQEKLTPQRYCHSLGVAETARKLAELYDYDPEKAELAGLLHDYAKDLPEEELKKYAQLSDWEIDREELNLPRLWHAPAAAFLVKAELGINDQEILEAIRFHTIGSPHMGKLAQIVFLADFIEPNRDYQEVEQLRTIAFQQGIERGIIEVINEFIKFSIERDQIIHPNTLLLRNAFLRRLT